MRVLVVDDEAAVRRSLEQALGMERYDVDLAQDGREALERVAAARYDAIVLDVGLTTLDGLEACRRMRAAGPTEHALLELFLRHPRQVLERSVVFEQVWGYDFGATSNVLGVYMGYLRRKTEAGGEPRLLHTLRGVGYILRQEPA
jgi:DNA-binding response OmpR family regulator